jgi:very-short-patch-repair endonuclease
MELPAELVTLAARQAGVVSRAQALATGLSGPSARRLLASGVWQRPLRGVFVTHNGPIDRTGRIWAAVLRAGPGAVASHETAAQLMRLIDEPPSQIHLTVPSNRRAAVNVDNIHIHYCHPDLLRVDPVRRPPMTAPLHTILDLINEATTPDRVVALVAAGCQRRLATPGAIAAFAATRAKLRWRRLLAEVCRDVRAGVESPLEHRYLRNVERAHRLPTGTRQHVVRVGAATYRHDVSYARFGLVVELDGLAYHRGERAASDATRDNALHAAGLVVLRYRWADVVATPCATAAQVAAALGQRGWTGRLTPCRKCQR